MRRSLQQCGAACGLPKGLLNARTLRRTRALELERRGLPPSVINIFLGRAQPHTGGARFAPETAARMLHEQIQGEQCMKTSARNVFQGRIVELARHGLLTHVALRTAEGLRVTAVITNESDKALGLTEGALVNASVKAPWVMLLPGALPDSASAPAENCYTGIVERIREDGMVAEVLVALPEGMMICALCGKGTELPRGLAQGQTVTAYFKSFSVILTLE